MGEFRDKSGSNALLAVLCLAQFMLILDVAVVAVAVPSIQQSLAVAPADAQWVSTAYALAFGGFLIVSGKASDLLGARRVFLVGVLGFVTASLGCGLAQDAAQLLVARGAQGLAAAVVSPATLALLLAGFAEGPGRNRALGVWGAVASGGAVAGQLLGGFVVDLLDWRWIFLINAPVGLGVILLGYRLLPWDRPGAEFGSRLDVAGAALLTGGLVAVVFSVSRAAEGGLGAPVIASASAGLLALLAFAATERRVAARGGEPIVRFGLFENSHARYGNAFCLASAALVGAVVFLSTLHLQRVLGFSPLEAGLGFAPVTAAIAVVSSFSAKVVERLGLRATMLAGALLAAAGVGLLAFSPADGTYLRGVLPGLMLVGLGSGGSLAPAMATATTGVAVEERGMASGVLNTSLQIGGALGTAVLVSVAVAAASAAGPSSEALADGYRAGFRWTGVLPPLMALFALLLPREVTGGGSQSADGTRGLHGERKIA